MEALIPSNRLRFVEANLACVWHGFNPSCFYKPERATALLLIAGSFTSLIVCKDIQARNRRGGKENERGQKQTHNEKYERDNALQVGAMGRRYQMHQVSAWIGRGHQFVLAIISCEVAEAAANVLSSAQLFRAAAGEPFPRL